MTGFELFFRLFRKAGWPPPSVFVQGLAPLLVWHALGIVSDASDQVRLSWAVLIFLTVIIWTQCRAALNVALQQGMDRDSLARPLFGYWVVLAWFVYLSQELGWAQHWITAIFSVQAILFLANGMSRRHSLNTDEDVANDGGAALAAALFPLYAGLALMNATLVARVSPEAWMIWIGILPLLVWGLTRTVTLTVLLSQEGEE